MRIKVNGIWYKVVTWSTATTSTKTWFTDTTVSHIVAIVADKPNKKLLTIPLSSIDEYDGLVNGL